MKMIKLPMCLWMDTKDTPWSTVGEFEQWFAVRLAQSGVQAEKIEVVNGGVKGLDLYLSPLPQVKNAPPPRAKPPGKQLQALKQGVK